MYSQTAPHGLSAGTRQYSQPCSCSDAIATSVRVVSLLRWSAFHLQRMLCAFVCLRGGPAVCFSVPLGEAGVCARIQSTTSPAHPTRMCVYTTRTCACDLNMSESVCVCARACVRAFMGVSACQYVCACGWARRLRINQGSHAAGCCSSGDLTVRRLSRAWSVIATYSMEHDTCNIRHATYHMQRATCSIPHATCNKQHPAECNMQQHATHNIQHATYNMQLTECNMQHATNNM